MPRLSKWSLFFKNPEPPICYTSYGVLIVLMQGELQIANNYATKL